MNRDHAVRAGIMKSSQSARRRSGERGVAVIMTAGFMLLGILALALVVDTGRLYMEKRSLQRVADLAALEAASLNGCVLNAEGDLPVQQFAAASARRNGFSGNGTRLLAQCGDLAPTGGEYNPANFVAGDGRIAQVEVWRTVPASLVAGGMFSEPIELYARAAARRGGLPEAALTIRSTLATVDSTQGALLNAVVGGLLGGAVNLSVGSWNGLLGTDIKLLSYLDLLAVDLGLDVGDYDAVLGTEVSVGRLLDVAVDALSQGAGSGSTADINAAILGLNGLGLSIPGATPLVKLGDLLNVQTGTDAAGLGADVNLLQLVQGSIQLANGESAVVGNLPITIPGVAGVGIKFKVMEPAQASAVGDPQRAKDNPLGEGDRIFVRTAQVRTLVSVDLPIVGGVLTALEGLLNSSLISGVTTAVNDLLSLNLLGLLSSLSCTIYCDIQRDVVNLKVLPSPRLDLNIDAGGGQAYVNDFECDAGTKSLSVPTQTSTAAIRIGQMGATAAAAAAQVFASDNVPTVSPIPLIDIGSKRIRYECTLLVVCTTTWKKGAGWTSNEALADRVAFAGGGIGLKINSSAENNTALAGSNSTLAYTNPPETLPDVNYRDPVTGDLAPQWKKVTSTNLVGSLASTLAAPTLEIYRPTGGGLGAGLGNVISLVGSVVNTLVSSLQSIIKGVLSPILDPLLNSLLKSLGVNLNEVEVGANLTCGANEGVQLLY